VSFRGFSPGLAWRILTSVSDMKKRVSEFDPRFYTRFFLGCQRTLANVGVC
jgi:hypothetical protein